MPRKFLRKPEVLARLSMKREALREAIANGLFPPGVPIFPGGRVVGWDETVVDAYIERRTQEEPPKEKGSFPKPKDKTKRAAKAKR